MMVTQVLPDDEVLEELIGAGSPLGNLPTETDVDALIDLLRTSSPSSSSKPISHTSTISINDILDDDPDLETLDPDLDPTLDLSFDDVARTVLETVPESRDAEEPTFRFSADQNGFGFGLNVSGGDRISEDIGQQTTVSADNRQPANTVSLESVEETHPVKAEFSESTDQPTGISSDSSRVDMNPPKDGFAGDMKRNSNQHDVVVSHADTEAEENQVDASAECPVSAVPHVRSCAAVVEQHRVESSDSVEVSEIFAVGPDLAGKDQLLDSSPWQGEQVDRKVHDEQTEMSSVAATQQSEPVVDHKSEFRFASDMSQDGASVQTLADSVKKRSGIKQPGHSKVRPRLTRRKSCDELTVKSSVAEVKKENVSWLTAYFEGVHAEQCPGCTICFTGVVQRPFVIRRRSSLPGETTDITASPGELVTDGARHNLDGSLIEPTPTLVVGSPSGADPNRATSAPKPASYAAGLGQTSNTLPARIGRLRASVPKELKSDANSNSLTSVSAAVEHGLDQTSDGPGVSTTSRRVASLPDVTGDSTSRTRESQRRAEFRFRLARVRSHSLRSFNDLAAFGVAKRSAAESAMPPIQHSRSATDREQKANTPDGLAAQQKSLPESFEPAVFGQVSPEVSCNRGNSVGGVVAEDRKTVATVSLDNLLTELCSPTTTTADKDSGGPLTPDMIRMYRIKPERRGPADHVRGGRGSVHARRASDDDVLRRNCVGGGLEQRIDAMLFNVDARWSDEEWQRHQRPARRNVPRTIATAAPHHPAVQQVTSDRSLQMSSTDGLFSIIQLKRSGPVSRS